jgi:hypothetical protein
VFLWSFGLQRFASWCFVCVPPVSFLSVIQTCIGFELCFLHAVPLCRFICECNCHGGTWCIFFLAHLCDFRCVQAS